MLPNVYFGEVVFKPNHATKLLPVNLISCKMFIQLFLFSTAYFLPLQRCVQSQKEIFFYKIVNFLSLNI